MSNIKLHLGCGTNAPKGWVNIEGSVNAWLSKHKVLRTFVAKSGFVDEKIIGIKWPENIIIKDLTKGLGYNDNSVDCIYTSHTLEHLYKEDAKKLLEECNRVLKKCGVLRVVVPDLESITKGYVSGNYSADDLMERLNVIPNRSKLPLVGRVFDHFNSKNYHKWMYDSVSLSEFLKDAGFRNIKRKRLYDSKISGIKIIEKHERFADSICLECVRL